MKDKIALLTDSACDLPPEVIKEYSIHVLPLKIIYGTEEYSDRVDIQPEEVYAQMPDRIPTTAMPGLGEIREVLERIKNQGFNKVMAIHLSAGLSGTHDAVKMIAQEFKDLYIECLIPRFWYGPGVSGLGGGPGYPQRTGLGQVLENVRQLRPKINIYYVLRRWSTCGVADVSAG